MKWIVYRGADREKVESGAWLLAAREQAPASETYRGVALCFCGRAAAHDSEEEQKNQLPTCHKQGMKL
jgi:hypothetical protein